MGTPSDYNNMQEEYLDMLTITGLHAYACDCVTHHLFHPNGTDCLRKGEDEEMMHQVAADDSLQSKPQCHFEICAELIQRRTRPSHLSL